MATQNVFGFSVEPSSGGEFLPILKYDARAGRFFRVDRMDTGTGFVSEAVDITGHFKAVVDFDNVEVGWMLFPVGSAPVMALVPIGEQLPARPGKDFKNGIRFLVKLSKECVGPDNKSIREVAGTSRAFLSGVQAAYLEYKADREKNPGKLPVLTLVKTTPVKTGSGERSSTNYQPEFRIAGWVARGDLKPMPKAMATATNGSGQTVTQSDAAPATGAKPMAPPKQEASLADDFG